MKSTETACVFTPSPFQEGISNLSNLQLTITGAWGKYVTDYWRFVYDWSNQFFALIVQAVKSADPIIS
jgi:hypothetical protein